jgi:hypothetical protein
VILNELFSIAMRKFFGEKFKHKSLNMPLVPLNKNDEKSIINSETTDSGEKSKKLFVVVSGK